ncbi:NAD(P)H-dependent oxidoreductase [Marinomonas sp. C2222]|uniref:NAD(P)H-dependent oxidoreductase n=1 Tax=Marinomonas sargassi TaxID=2984494 RepID=A0ABT2YUA2_9GAMM|nr:NAD(P)H-dependent oxidoreductase [Marinomonas sargassi]MCV2403436.1 NAD(P)H-dependent oxidoreductase [Marinomonas sargassi]
MMDLFEALKWRYAVKKFSREVLPNEEVRELLKLARLSASSYGLQPYRLLLVKDEALRSQLLPNSFNQEQVVESSHLIVFAVPTDIGDHIVDQYITQHASKTRQTSSKLANFSEHMKGALRVKSNQQRQEWAIQQAYIALGNLLTCAAMMKIDTCPMTGIDPHAYDEVLGLKERGLTTAFICPIGRRDPDDVKMLQPKIRKSFIDLVEEI